LPLFILSATIKLVNLDIFSKFSHNSSNFTVTLLRIHCPGNHVKILFSHLKRLTFYFTISVLFGNHLKLGLGAFCDALTTCDVT